MGGILSLTLDPAAPVISLNPANGEATATSVMDDISPNAFYLPFAPDGKLYVLDYGNERMVSFDPGNGFEQIGEFSLCTELTPEDLQIANTQFAIGRDGSFYLGDGLGGGSPYGADGTSSTPSLCRVVWWAIFTPELPISARMRLGVSTFTTARLGFINIRTPASRRNLRVGRF